MPKKRDRDDTAYQPPPPAPTGRSVDPLVTVETQREQNLFSGEWAERTFVKLYVAARESGLLAAISDRDWKTLCTLATYMDGDGYCYPSQAELAKAMGCSRQMANERIRSLAEFRFRGQRVLLVVKGERTGKGEWSKNGYLVQPISRLRIYDSDADAADPAPKNGHPTVSRKVDTGPAIEPTVSSPTVTVRLDTNKNHALELDFDLSNFERSRSFELTENGAAANSRLVPPKPDRPPRDSDDSVVQDETEASTRYVPLDQALRLREQAAATIGQGRRRLHDDPSATPQVRAVRPPRNRTGALKGTADERERLAAFLGDFATELGDEAPLSATITRALNVFKTATVPPELWGDHLYRARAITQEHTAQITKQAGDGATGFRRKNKLPYYFAVLEQLVGLRPEPALPIAGVEHDP